MDNTDLLKKTKNFIRLYKFFPKKRFGQNFIVSSKILERLVSYATLTKDDTVLEIGTGFGYLTNLLSTKCKKVITVEIDQILVNFLREQFLELKNIELIEGNILDVYIPDFNKVVAAPPYSISSLLLFKILEKKFDSAFFIFQKEFAQRLVASVGTKDYSRLTVSIYYRANVELLGIISKRMFYPQPDVDSMIVHIKPREQPFQVKDEEIFFDLVRRACLEFFHRFLWLNPAPCPVCLSLMHNFCPVPMPRPL